MSLKELPKESDVSSHKCVPKFVEVHGHLQCSVCGRVVEACCEGSPPPDEQPVS